MEEQQYLDLVRQVLEKGVVRPGRGGPTTRSIFGHQSRYSLKDGTLPLLTTKKVFTRGIIEELLWLIRGSTNVDELKERNVHIWDGHSSREHLDNFGLSHLREGDIGPCFPAGTLVLSDSGYKDISKITYDDKLYTHTGSFHSIEKVMERDYSGELFKIKLKYHPHGIISTPEHPFYARKFKIKRSSLNTGRKQSLELGSPDFIPVKNLTKQHLVGMKIDTEEKMPIFEIPKYKNQHVEAETEIKCNFTEDEFFMFGYFLGDGWLVDEATNKGSNMNKRIYFVMNSKQEEFLITKFKQFLNLQICKKKEDSYSTYKCFNKTYSTILETFGKYAKYKVIPEWVHNSPKHLVKAFLDGYYFADGCYDKDKNKMRACTISKNIAFSVQRLFLKLGNFCSVSVNKRGYRETKFRNKESFFNDAYYMEVSIGENHRRSNWCFIEDEYAWFTITDLESDICAHPVKVYNFTVSVDNTYTVENATVHNCYGFQWRHAGATYRGCDENYDGEGVDQLEQLVFNLKNSPTSRRHVVSAWGVSNIHEMALPPCHCLFQFYVDENGLSCQLYQRSGDIGLGVPFNITSYAILTHIIAKLVGVPAHEFIHTLGDAHIYTDHEDALKEQITRDPFPFPKLEINANIQSLEDVEKLSASDFNIVGYQCHPKITMKMVV
jgi:thymidylate synthase